MTFLFYSLTAIQIKLLRKSPLLSHNIHVLQFALAAFLLKRFKEVKSGSTSLAKSQVVVDIASQISLYSSVLQEKVIANKGRGHDKVILDTC